VAEGILEGDSMVEDKCKPFIAHEIFYSVCFGFNSGIHRRIPTIAEVSLSGRLDGKVESDLNFECRNIARWTFNLAFKKWHFQTIDGSRRDLKGEEDPFVPSLTRSSSPLIP
jgi:hypothetical protein